VKKLVDFFSDANIFKGNSSDAREMTKDFFWSRVRKPDNASSARMQRKEQCTVSVANQSLHDRLCGNECVRKDFDQFGSDCDDDYLQSITSTCCDSQANNMNQPEEENQPADADNWENLKEEDRSGKIEDALKHRGNEQKKKLSPNILKDLLGDDSNHALKGIKKE